MTKAQTIKVTNWIARNAACYTCRTHRKGV